MCGAALGSDLDDTTTLFDRSLLAVFDAATGARLAERRATIPQFHARERSGLGPQLVPSSAPAGRRKPRRSIGTTYTAQFGSKLGVTAVGDSLLVADAGDKVPEGYWLARPRGLARIAKVPLVGERSDAVSAELLSVHLGGARWAIGAAAAASWCRTSRPAPCRRR